ncbi:MAG TPA: carbamate kinase [Polyangiaceae bacterium]|jgi:carbamate kinase|nr:MAG: Carbamate kinase 1 [Deltaproteobacteria bacterium ADurb.Bin207]HNS97140.1 carbamate kinase [Polyangiaceae bacterium]HNZ22195.1 carbamate kinase [Polyangiaceae bacterium]HOD23962.1 carbamate kinase [Polyangiaceae bacterium]HOE47019.1 carbamate kinase [Polyangiaceae bacterium]
MTSLDRSHPVAVVAIGGNSLIKDKHHQEVRYQWDAARETCFHIANMIEKGWTVVVTHGNGPQVGFILRRNEIASSEVHTTPLDAIVADTQGSIGYMLQQSLNNEFVRRGLQRHAFTIVTQVLVDKNDSAFKDPTKPIGSFMDETTAMQMKQAEGWDVVEDAGRGWRRVVASPHPVQVVEQDAITAAVQQGWIVIAGGGGGIPVVQTPQGLEGVAAVIDKDRLSALLAAAIKADLFVISTAVEKVCLHYGKPNQQDLTHITAEQARQYMNEGHFAPGSMKPKMEAVLQFLDEGGKRAIITNPENLERALLGETGTVIEGH